jgi:hypothetical protein
MIDHTHTDDEKKEQEEEVAVIDCNIVEVVMAVELGY